MPAPDHLAMARRFAAALDDCDFDEARRLLSADCRYHIGPEELVGPDAIISSYSASAEWAEQALDQVIYESDVEPSGDHFSVTYTDRTMHHGEMLAYRSRQHVWLNTAGQVFKIVHEELPGEREQLDAFFARHGVKRGNRA